MSEWSAIVEQLGLKRSGAEWRGACPLHGGSNKSQFVVSTSKGAFHCFACGAGGSLTRLARLLGKEPPRWSPPLRPEPTRAMERVAALRPLDPTHPFFAERGIHAGTARSFGSGYFAGTPPFGGRVVVPIHDVGGMLVGHIGRALGNEEPRYILQRGVARGALLFNAHRVSADAPFVIVVEGVFDAFAVTQIGYRNVVATLGCEASARQIDALRRYPAVKLLFDADDAGKNAASALAEAIGATAAVVDIPKADPCSIKGVLLAQVIRGSDVSTPVHEQLGADDAQALHVR
jgi:5S rRNA maturation endonuclease (ribonuclease M5)